MLSQGKLDLDAPIGKYLPNFPEKLDGIITTRLLASHLAGMCAAVFNCICYFQL
jgi:CubicO group peptidase (beta-lactamase class C family)